ncbi:MAG: cyclic nucleotide-binding domain-containing protein [Phycisphaera sp. RhM]|nr:cyclic nucleotide-binding domain-containing protein [Phycisphaera sp. RhM]
MHRDAFVDLVAELDEDPMPLAQIIKNRFVSTSLRRALEGVVEGDLPELGELPLVRFDNADWIIREGDSSDFAYIIVSGSVEVFCHRGADELSLANLVEGDLFGETGVLENRPHPASVQASEPTIVARLSPESLQKILDQSKAAASGMKLLIARRLLQTYDKLRE